ncbi:cation channel sperm-associated protein subunit epsilon-like [Electrophorus electricus]|uniref:cation channel sperm-associated protein subunit epsilon-like n=1 Tax=Electrophorus electricus TaxID=8005 RepID=UPI0015D00A4A|nr:cation channel sperm-associated protein subunit epsilon-like [Electrophorus electricus]
MKCKVPGFKTIKPLLSKNSLEEEERYLFISNSVFSFAWYAVILRNRNISENGSRIVRLWIINPEEADPAEINNTAVVPSALSQYITKQFFNKGQFPEIVLSLSSETFQIYFTSGWYWEALVPDNHKYNSFFVVGQPVSLWQQFVASSQHTFYWAEPAKPYRAQEVPVRLAAGSQLSVVWGTCAPHRALLLTDQGIFMTEDSFGTHQEVMVEPGDLHVPPQGYFRVDDAALLENGIIFRIGNTLLWRANEDRVLRKHEVKLFSEGVRGLKFREHCVDHYPAQNFELATVITWTSHNLFIGGKSLNLENSNSYFKNTLMPLWPNATILTASFGSYPTTLAALVTFTEYVQPLLLTYCEIEGVWGTSPFLTAYRQEDIPKGPFQMMFISSALSSLLMWNREVILFSFHNDTRWGYLHPINETNLSQATNGSHIHQVVMDSSLNMLVKMENNMLFFCKVGMERLVRMHPWTEPGVPAALYLNPEEQFIMISLEEGRVQAQSYPVRSESRSTTRGDPDSCPFITFTHSMSKLTYYIDKGNCLELWADVVYPENKGVNVQLLSNRKQLLMIKERTYFESVYGVDKKNKEADYRNVPNYSDLMVQTSGIVSFELLPDQLGNTCEMPKKQISHFHVGCPPNRHIRVAKPWEVPCEMNIFKSYTISGAVLRNPQQEDLVACLCEAQTWKKMLAGGSPLEKAWGPENYRSCFVLGSGKLGNLNQPYEVMNRSSMNYLTFPSVENTTYVFNVKILDPNYSFCDLQAVFAVQTYGEKIW